MYHILLAASALVLAGCTTSGGGSGSVNTAPTLGLASGPADTAAMTASPPEIAQARREIAGDRPGKALSVLDRWLESPASVQSPWVSEALYLRGNAKLMSGDEDEALYDYEEIVKNHPGSEFFQSALERELDAAVLYFHGKLRPVLGVRIDSGVPVAEEIVLRIAERLPGSPLAEKALLEMADYYARDHDLKMAAETYDVFVRLYPRSTKIRFAEERRLYCTIAQFKGPRYDRAVLKEAQIQAQNFSREYPEAARRAGIDGGLSARLDESSAASLLAQANWYIARGDGPAARVVLARLLAEHPRTASAQRAIEVLGTLARTDGGSDQRSERSGVERSAREEGAP